MRPKARCQKCRAELMSYWLKAGVCNGCRNPDLVVTAEPSHLTLAELDALRSELKVEITNLSQDTALQPIMRLRYALMELQMTEERMQSIRRHMDLEERESR